MTSTEELKKDKKFIDFEAKMHKSLLTHKMIVPIFDGLSKQLKQMQAPEVATLKKGRYKNLYK